MSYFDDFYEPVVLGMGFAYDSRCRDFKRRKHPQHLVVDGGVLCGVQSGGKRPLRATLLPRRVRCKECLKIMNEQSREAEK